MIPGNYAMTVYRGSTYKEIITPAIVLTGYTDIVLSVYPPWIGSSNEPVVPTPLLSLSMSEGGITLVETDTAIQILISAAGTAAFAFENGIYVLELITAGTPDVIDSLLTGSFTVINGVPSWLTR